MYLTENSEPIPSVLVEQLQDLVDDGFLTLESDAEKANQLPIYKRCMEQHRHKHNWKAFIDIDEYIVIRACAPLLEVLLSRRPWMCSVLCAVWRALVGHGLLRHNRC